MKIEMTFLYVMIATAAICSPVASSVGGKHISFNISELEEYSASSYVQEGLVAMWDGIENVGLGVHDAEATVWKDLIGTHDIVLGKLGIGDDHIILNGSMGTGQSPINNIMHIEIVELHTTYGLIAQFGNVPFTCMIFAYPAGTYNFSQAINNSSIPTVINEVNCVSVGYSDSNNGELAFAYRNGESAIIGNRRGNLGFYGLRIGSSTSTYMPIIGKLYSIRLYSRTLSEDEIAYNYSIDQVRFGL